MLGGERFANNLPDWNILWFAVLIPQMRVLAKVGARPLWAVCNSPKRLRRVSSVVSSVGCLVTEAVQILTSYSLTQPRETAVYEALVRRDKTRALL